MHVYTQKVEGNGDNSRAPLYRWICKSANNENGSYTSSDVEHERTCITYADETCPDLFVEAIQLYLLIHLRNNKYYGPKRRSSSKTFSNWTIAEARSLITLNFNNYQLRRADQSHVHTVILLFICFTDHFSRSNEIAIYITQTSNKFL